MDEQNIVTYEHHGQMVWVRDDLKGMHREYCLCYRCMDLEECQTAKELLEFDKAHGLVTPVWECPSFKAQPASIFIICPVRIATEVDNTLLAKYVQAMEYEGRKVYWPSRDTVQAQDGLMICADNCRAIKEADEVHILWREDSAGSKFDLGVAFALGKRIKLIEPVERTEKKSFEQMLHDWAADSKYDSCPDFKPPVGPVG